MSTNYVLLNLGCGVKTSPLAQNIDWSIYLRIAKNPFLMALTKPLLSSTRRQRLESLRGLDVVPHNLAKGIPVSAGSVDMVYHSHLLEHLDREVAEAFLREIFRVLKAGGRVRIAVPDLELYVRQYLASLESSLHDQDAAKQHDEKIAVMYEQSVRREGAGTGSQRPLVRWIEKLTVGDARSKGETHQWMYDRVSLRVKLENAGFKDVIVHSFDTSGYALWNEVGLDRDGDKPYKPESLYVEAVKP